VVNGYDHAYAGLKVKASIYDINAKEKASEDVTLNIPADSSTRAFQLPAVESISPTYFLKLELQDALGKLLSENFYWLSTQQDVLDWPKKFEEVYTPQSAYADLSGLNSLPEIKLSVQATVSRRSGEQVVHAVVQNPSSNLAFMVHLRVANSKTGEDIVPIFWDENYFSLLPGEKREVSAQFAPSALVGADAVLVVDGWNVVPHRANLLLK
jgi:exo-1,4-beta-D-glucosaminidase